MNPTDWRKGSFRLWIVASALWVLAIGILANPYEEWQSFKSAESTVSRSIQLQNRIEAGISDGTLKLENGTIAGPEKLADDLKRAKAINRAGLERRRRAIENLRSQVTAMTVPPAVLLVLGLAVAWVIKGFRGYE